MDTHRDYKLGFDIVIGRSDFGYARRPTFVTMRCERSDKYKKTYPEVEKG